MDSEESRPCSSASNSSDSSANSENSRKSGSIRNEDHKSVGEASLQSNDITAVGRLSRASSRSSNTMNGRSPRSPSRSDSDSSSSSSSSSENDEDEDAKSPEGTVKPKSNKSSIRSSSEDSSRGGKTEGAVSRNQSISSVRMSSPRSSRNSSESSNRSGDVDNREDGAVNMSHEDLSDVSEMDSEKRDFKDTRKNCNEDEVTNISYPEESHHHVEEDNRRHSVDHYSQPNSLDENSRMDLRSDNCGPQPTKDNSQDGVITDLRQKLDQKKNQLKAMAMENKGKKSISNGSKCNGTVAESIEELVKTHDEDALDFEAEEGECQEVLNDEKEMAEQAPHQDITKDKKSSDGEAEDGEELEEGEVSDEDEKRPEETEPKRLCRFYTRGQCTWGMSCRFLHPGVTDKGNYTMFDLVRPVPLPQTGGGRTNQNFIGAPHDNYHDYRTERPSLHHRAPLLHHPLPVAYPAPHHDPRGVLPPSAVQEPPVVVESAWERGLRTAKEMMRKANKRKEQDNDFEDKKMNLTLSPDELEKDPYYIKERTTPETAPPYGRHPIYQDPAGIYSPPERFGRGPPMPAYDDVDPYGRSTRYRELPPHRMPQYEDDRRVRPAREVIVQRVEPVGRGDEWNDPWMRSKSPGGRALSDRERGEKRRRDRRSYSSHSSYSSSSSSQSDSSSASSRSVSPSETRRRYGTHKSSPSTTRRNVRTAIRSPSPRRRLSPSVRRSPVTKRRGHLTPSPAIDKRNAYSPVSKRKKNSPPAKKSTLDKSKAKRRQRSSSSGSGSSESSGSDSDSSGTSTSETSSRSREKTPVKRIRASEKVTNERKIVKKEMIKKRSPISIEIKKQAIVGASALTSPTNSISSEKETKKTRREELLKQLRAVEDAIAKKKSKLS